MLHPRPVRCFPRVASTNDIAIAWLTDGAPQGALVIADEQTQGRGRLGRTWFAPPGTSLLFSIIMRPTPMQLPRLTMLGGLAVYEALHEFGVKSLGIKWANDVQINGRKAAGILPEAVWEGNTLKGAILGIGVNVSVDFADSPYRDTATSIQQVLDAPIDRVELLKSILARVDAWADRLESAALFETWRDTLNTIGHYVSVDGRRAIAEGVDQDGALLIREESGILQRVIAGDILLG